MKIVLASMPRSGSEFVHKLTKNLMGENFPNQLFPITPGRIIQNNYSTPKELKDKIVQNRGIDFFTGKGDHFFKIESPGKDTLCLELSSLFSDIKWIASMRKIENIIISHYNIKKWGWDEQKILNAYKNDMMFYEYVAAKRGLFVVNIDKPSQLNLQRMMDYFGIDQISASTENFIKSWKVVNPLNKQKKQAGEVLGDREIPPNIHTLRSRHPWLNDIERKMHFLWESCI